MATFSSSPAPRRSSRLHQNATSPPRRNRQNQNNSRLNTPLRSAVNDDVSLTPAMDVDDSNSITSDRSFMSISRAETIFAKSDQLSVSFYADLPVEVSQILKNADFYRDLYSGEIDTSTGFALVASMQTCFVWQHALAVKGIPTCYIFACPWDYNQTSPPFHSLIPYGPGREPGLILISIIGEIRFWDSIGIGLAGGENYTTTYLNLESEDLVTNLLRVDSQTYVVSTTSGLLIQLLVTSSGGRYHLTSRPFSKPAPSLSLSRLIPSIFSQSASASTSQITAEPGNVSALALGAKSVEGSREIWALVDSRIQRWEMKLEGWEEIMLDEDVADAVRAAVRRTFGESVEMDDAGMDLELLDLAIDGANKLVVLVSYAGQEESGIMTMDVSNVKRIYALVQFSLIGDMFRVESVKSVPYQSTFSSGAPMHPRIQLLPEGLLASVQFGDAVVLCARETHYQERLELKSASDRTLGVGVTQVESVVLVLTAATMMKVNVDIDQVLKFNPETGRAHLIKSIMTQAILYGSLPLNPLHFSFPPDVDEESLMQGAEQLSRAVLESDPELVRSSYDMTAQLRSRKDRLTWLIQFINENAVLLKMSQISRQTLVADAEKLNAAYTLWIQHNDFLATVSPPHSVLNDIVFTYMVQIEEAVPGQAGDHMRAFFRRHVAELGSILHKIPDMIKNAPQQTGKTVVDLLPESNRILLSVLQSAFEYREANVGMYGIELPMVKPWTSEPGIIDAVLSAFNHSTTEIESGTLSDSIKAEIRMPELATILLACVYERIDWLRSPTCAEDSAARSERVQLEEQFDTLRPQTLEILRRNGYAEDAFSLAETYLDYRSLADLCNSETVFPLESNPYLSRIQGYIERFKEEFTTELYRWYIQHGEVRVIFAQDSIYDGYLDKFFETNPQPSISWLHDLSKQRHGAAAVALAQAAVKETSLDTRHLILSIGKLSHLAHLQESEQAADEGLFDEFHDDLDFVSVHQTLSQEFNNVLGNIRGRRSLDTQLDTIVKERASRIKNTKELVHLFKNFVRELLQGKVLSAEDVVDVLTLKDNVDTPEDYATALHLLARCQLPQARKTSAFRTVWRRIYLHDDWKTIGETANVTDTELSRRYQSTAFYVTLLEILPRGLEPEGPDVALMIPTPEEVSSRWPGMPQDQIDRLMEDYEDEQNILGELDVLHGIHHRILELAAQEASPGLDQ
ncbi:hypothetical protein K435DRAFT_969042 [Dendrothele bispora CBS 962.96]|uniref:Nucleoporin Nup133/Nup155-like C-terminal domain-containing protein n=1 Tax=Dendrothele bispora (strain CBS 962.96) TaxID=1314807 RepID=A0A4S8LLF7_DENBC|nr:hypothetical protein K435DRAFT_969042 [Dendrothele bispora CBS 962.96]